MTPLPSSPAHTAAAALRRARKLLFVRMHRLAALPDTEFCAGFESVVVAIEADLAHEEAVMETLAFDGLRKRRADNALLLAALHRTVTPVETGDAALGRAALTAAGDLLSMHRLTTDLALVLAHATSAAPDHVHGVRPPRALAVRKRRP